LCHVHKNPPIGGGGDGGGNVKPPTPPVVTEHTINVKETQGTLSLLRDLFEKDNKKILLIVWVMLF
jgi:hypothetical protein